MKLPLFFMEADAGGGTGNGTSSLIADPEPTNNGQQQSTTDIIGGDGSFSDGWIERLGEDFKDSRESLGSFKNVRDLAKSYIHTKSLVGKKTLVPNENSSPEDIAAFRKAMGIPEKIEEYNIKPEKLPDGIDWNDDLAKPFVELAHKHNIPPKAMSDIVAKYAEQKAAEQALLSQQIDDMREKGLSELRNTFKSDFENKIAIAQKAAATAGVDPKSFGFGDPAVVKALVRLGEMISDDKLVSSGGSGSGVSAAAEAKRIQTDPSHPLHQKYLDQDPDTIERLRSLLRKA